MAPPVDVRADKLIEGSSIDILERNAWRPLDNPLKTKTTYGSGSGISVPPRGVKFEGLNSQASLC